MLLEITLKILVETKKSLMKKCLLNDMLYEGIM